VSQLLQRRNQKRSTPDCGPMCKLRFRHMLSSSEQAAATDEAVLTKLNEPRFKCLELKNTAQADVHGKTNKHQNVLRERACTKASLHQKLVAKAGQWIWYSASLSTPSRPMLALQSTRCAS